MAVQGAGVVLRLKAVVGGHPLQAAEGRLAAPGVGEPVTALQAVDALEGVLATQLACGRAAEAYDSQGRKTVLLMYLQKCLYRIRSVFYIFGRISYFLCFKYLNLRHDIEWQTCRAARVMTVPL